MGIQPSPVLIDTVVKLPRLSRETCRLSCGRVDGVEATASPQRRRGDGVTFKLIFFTPSPHQASPPTGQFPARPDPASN